MKFETHLTAKITDEGRVKVDIQGPANELLSLLEEEAVNIFKELKNEGYPDTLDVMREFYTNIIERVFLR